MQLSELRELYLIPDAWRDLGLPGAPGRCCQSPFPEEHRHGDRKPSFSVYDDGRKAKDQATGEHFSVFDFVAKARGCSFADAVAWVRERVEGPSAASRSFPKKRHSAVRQPTLPNLTAGTDSDFCRLSELRGFSEEALRIASERGLLRFATLWGRRAWCICDSRQQLFEFRRLDGKPWPAHGRLGERKAHCIGQGKDWPNGVREAEPFPRIMVVEGAPDLLATFHFISVEEVTESVAPVAVLGTGNRRFAPESLRCFRGKSVCLYPHVDEAGKSACRTWAQQIRDAGASRVTAFDLSGIVRDDGGRGKDLADACRLSANSYENEPKFRRVTP